MKRCSNSALVRLRSFGEQHPGIRFPVVTRHFLADDPSIPGDVTDFSSCDLYWVNGGAAHFVSFQAGETERRVLAFKREFSAEHPSDSDVSFYVKLRVDLLNSSIVEEVLEELQSLLLEFPEFLSLSPGSKRVLPLD